MKLLWIKSGSWVKILTWVSTGVMKIKTRYKFWTSKILTVLGRKIENWFVVLSSPHVCPCTSSPFPPSFSLSSSLNTYMCMSTCSLSLTPHPLPTLTLSRGLIPEGWALCLCLSSPHLLEAGVHRGCTHSLYACPHPPSLHCSCRCTCPLWADGFPVCTSSSGRTPFPAGGPDFH